MPHIFISDEHQANFLAQIRLYGVRCVHVEYDGAGDSGSVQEPTVTLDGDNWIRPSPTWTLPYSYSYDGKVEQVINDFADAIKCLCDAALDSEHINWYNDDGAYGAFVVEFHGDGAPSIRLTNNQRIMTTEMSEWSF
jgi:hypothetical protein